jgi:hypothetical protein
MPPGQYFINGLVKSNPKDVPITMVTTSAINTTVVGLSSYQQEGYVNLVWQQRVKVNGTSRNMNDTELID